MCALHIHARHGVNSCVNVYISNLIFESSKVYIIFAMDPLLLLFHAKISLLTYLELMCLVACCWLPHHTLDPCNSSCAMPAIRPSCVHIYFIAYYYLKVDKCPIMVFKWAINLFLQWTLFRRFRYVCRAHINTLSHTFCDCGQMRLLRDSENDTIFHSMPLLYTVHYI